MKKGIIVFLMAVSTSALLSGCGKKGETTDSGVKLVHNDNVNYKCEMTPAEHYHIYDFDKNDLSNLGISKQSNYLVIKLDGDVESITYPDGNEVTLTKDEMINVITASKNKFDEEAEALATSKKLEYMGYADNTIDDELTARQLYYNNDMVSYNMRAAFDEYGSKYVELQFNVSESDINTIPLYITLKDGTVIHLIDEKDGEIMVWTRVEFDK